MNPTSCRECSTPIRWVLNTATGELIRIELRADGITGPDRFRVTATPPNGRWEVEPMDQLDRAVGNVAHDARCVFGKGKGRIT